MSWAFKETPTNTEIRAVQEEVALHRQQWWEEEAAGRWGAGGGRQKDSNEDVKTGKGRKSVHAQELGLAGVSDARGEQ